jgi:hypothetical protein
VKYVGEDATTHERLVLIVGDPKDRGNRSFFAFPERIGTALGLEEINRRIGQQLADALDGIEGEEPL